MLQLGAWRTLRSAKGERSVDIASKEKYEHLIPLLEPVHKRHVPYRKLQKIQEQFHCLIRTRMHYLGKIEEFGLRLPELEILLEIEEPKMWFPVPGMYGGFCYWLER
jgi:hypothetical protein